MINKTGTTEENKEEESSEQKTEEQQEAPSSTEGCPQWPSPWSLWPSPCVYCYSTCC